MILDISALADGEASYEVLDIIDEFCITEYDEEVELVKTFCDAEGLDMLLAVPHPDVIQLAEFLLESWGSGAWEYDSCIADFFSRLRWRLEQVQHAT
ncbi:MAG: hypothetical protein AAF267_01360 [Deinococcota bacterium]